MMFSALLKQITTKLTIQMERKLTPRRYIILLIFGDMLFTLSCEGQFYSSTDEQYKRESLLNNPVQLNALQRSVQGNIFEMWYYKDKFKSLQDILLTPKLLDNAAIERETTKERLQNIVRKALLGQDIGVTVMGGSTSAGGGLVYDYSDLNGIYYRVFIDWWQKAIQPFTDSKVMLRNLAVGGTSSNFYSYCYKTLLKPQDSMDIVFLEFSLNDMIFKHSSLPMALPLEQLTRSVLSEPNSPAVIFVNFIRGDRGIAQCDNLENHGQTMLAWHYGITSVGLRSSLCPNPGNRKTPAMFSSDGNHASIIGHAQIALMIIDIVRNSLLGAIDSSQLGLFREPSRQLPRHAFYSMEKDNSGTKPLCFTLLTPDINDKYFNPSLYVKETKNIGFKEVKNETMGFRIRVQGIVAPSRSDGFGGWQAEKENSSLKLHICLPQDDMLGFNVTRSVVVVFRTHGFGGKARIWLDDRMPGIVINTYSVDGQTRLATVANHVTSGCHSLNVNTLDAGIITLCGVLAGASSKLTK